VSGRRIRPGPACTLGQSVPEVTVVIPTLNRWQLLSTGALRSALDQEDVEVEVVVVDDGSTDETPVGLAALDDNRVRVVRHEQAGGLARARNAGIAAAQTEWVAFLDDDDLWAPWKLRRQLDAAASEDATFVYSAALYVTGGQVELAPALEPEGLGPRLLAGEAIPAGGSNVMVKTELIRQVGGFDEEITHLGDFDCWIRLDPISKAARCDEPLLAYIQQPSGMHLHNLKIVPRDVRHLSRKYEREYAALGRQFDGEQFVVWVAQQHEGAGRVRQAGGVYLTAAWHYRRPKYLGHGATLLAGRRVRNAALRLAGRFSGRDYTSPAADASRHYPPPAWLAPHLSRSS
jgi:glycosyltransferase involved in cell wall biosynthesis